MTKAFDEVAKGGRLDSDNLERVAKELSIAIATIIGSSTVGDMGVSPEVALRALDLARASIAAMREQMPDLTQTLDEDLRKAANAHNN